MRHDRRRILSIVLTALLLLGGCGQGAASSATAVPTAAQPSPTVAQPAPTAPVVPATPTAGALPTNPSPAPTPPAAPSPTTAAPAPVAAPTAPPTATPAPRAGLPVRLKIPTLRVDAAVEYVGLTPEGAMDVPKDYDNTAWYEPGTRPGEPGNAVIAGHVDSQTGKAVFWDLGTLKPGDEVIVAGADGVERRFAVRAIEAYRRADAPLGRIFGPTSSARLNLITCDPESGFDRARREYGGNIVVYTEAIP